MTTGYDVHGLVPCQACGQPNGTHLSVCPLIPAPAIPEQTIEAVNDMEKKLGEAV